MSFWIQTPFTIEPTLTLDSWRAFFATPTYVGALWTTVSLWLITTLLVCLLLVCLLLGYPVALYIGLCVKNKTVQTALLALCVIPFLIRVLAWRPMLGSEGAINLMPMQFGVISAPLQILLFSPLAVVIGMVQIYVVFMVDPVAFMLSRIDPDLIEAARDLGAGRILRTIVLPLSMPSVVYLKDRSRKMLKYARRIKLAIIVGAFLVSTIALANPTTRVYRGSTQSPSVVFQGGFSAGVGADGSGGDINLIHHVWGESCNDGTSAWISTSSDQRTAEEFGLQSLEPLPSGPQNVAYLYTIRTDVTFTSIRDIFEIAANDTTNYTGVQRRTLQNRMEDSYIASEHEFIVHSIPTSNIVSARAMWFDSNDMIVYGPTTPNPHYVDMDTHAGSPSAEDPSFIITSYIPAADIREDDGSSDSSSSTCSNSSSSSSSGCSPPKRAYLAP
ncbi:hypothetical protein [Verminephrobacter aporrectodeae]|uniref:hypothetical protein n=1 Tax=Verminephrobacter aporrectodeae TaxID=1110389 RepID=UPI0022443B41|nr:hypothetical protein [Verminephrobacter aporrectodeae]